MGASIEEPATWVNEVLHHFLDASLHVKHEKYLFGVSETEFLAYLIVAEGIHPTPIKVKAIHNALVPQTK